MKRLVLLFVVILGLTACGIGVEDIPAVTPVVPPVVTPTPAPTPVGTSVNMTTFKGVFLGTSLGAQFSFPALFGTDSQGRSWSGSLTVVADGATTFESQSVTKCRTLVTIQLAGGTPVSGVTTSYFKASDGSPYKSISNTGITSTATNQVTLPATAKVGDFGDFIADTGSDGTVTTSTWALNPDYNGASILVFSSITKTGTTITGTEVESFYLDSAGVPTKLAISVTIPGAIINLSGNKN
jgi:hypothetical protein